MLFKAFLAGLALQAVGCEEKGVTFMNYFAQFKEGYIYGYESMIKILCDSVYKLITTLIKAENNVF